MGVVGHEVAVLDKLLDHGVTAVLDLDDVTVIHLGTHVLVARGHRGKRQVNVGFGKQRGGFLHALAVLCHKCADFLEKLVFQSANAIARTQNLGLHFLELLGNVSLSANQRLLADVVCGNQIGKGAADLNIVAEHLVISHLERLDAGALALGSSGLLNPVFAVAHDGAKLVHLGVIALGDHAAVTHRERRLFANARIDTVANVLQKIQLAINGAQLLALAGGKQFFDLRKYSRRVGNGAQILGVCRTVHDSGHESFQIQHAREQLGELLAQHKVAVQLLNCAQPLGNGRRRQERMLDPAAQKSCTGRGLGLIQHPEQRALLFLCAHGLGQLQIAACVGVHLQILAVGIDLQLLEIGRFGLLGFVNVIDQRAHGTNHGLICRVCGVHAIAKSLAYALQRIGVFKSARLIVAKHSAKAVGHKACGGRKSLAREVGDHLTRRIGGKLGAKSGLGLIAVKRRRADLCRGNIRKAHANGILAHIDRAEIVVLLLGEQDAFNNRTGRDHAHHVALDKPLGGGRIFDLLANGHLVALGDQLTDIPLRRMERHAAHGCALGLAAIAAGQRQLQLARGGDGIVKEHLVKVTQAVKQKIILIFIFDLKILLHHGSHGLILAFSSVLF